MVNLSTFTQYIYVYPHKTVNSLKARIKCADAGNPSISTLHLEKQVEQLLSA